MIFDFEKNIRSKQSHNRGKDLDLIFRYRQILDGFKFELTEKEIN